MTWGEMAKILESAQNTLERDYGSIRNSYIDFDANQMVKLMELIDENHAEGIGKVLADFSADFTFSNLHGQSEEIITSIYFRLAIGVRFCRLLEEMHPRFSPNHGEEHAVIQHILINAWQEFYPAAIKML
jgi:hypothetical protein